MDLVLIRLVDMRFSGGVLRSDFNQICGHEIDPVMLDQSWNTGWYEK